MDGGDGGLRFAAVRGLLTAVVSSVAEQSPGNAGSGAAALPQ